MHVLSCSISNIHIHIHGIRWQRRFLKNAIANETRDVVAQILSSPFGGHLHVCEKRIVRVRDLLKSAAKEEGVSEDEYVDMVRTGVLQGGGPELTVLSNVLRRPISIYELVHWDKDIFYKNEKKCNIFIPSKCEIKCVGSFGDIYSKTHVVKYPIQPSFRRDYNRGHIVGIFISLLLIQVLVGKNMCVLYYRNFITLYSW